MGFKPSYEISKCEKRDKHLTLTYDNQVLFLYLIIYLHFKQQISIFKLSRR